MKKNNSNGEAQMGVEEGPAAKRKLNSETSFGLDRECQLAVAADDRIKSVLRGDVELTTDKRAYDEMFKYIESNPDSLDMHKDSSIAHFYEGRSVFITGASGFVGKVSISVKGVY